MRSLPFVKIVNQKMSEKKIGIRELARSVSLDASFFSKVLSGKRNPPADEKILMRIAKVLELDPELDLARAHVLDRGLGHNVR